MSKEFPHPFGDIKERYQAMRRALPRDISMLALGVFQDNFRLQGYKDQENGEVVPWAPRQNDKGSKRAILIKTGRLRRGLRPAPSGDYARVINAVPYAAVHNRGLRIRGQRRALATNLRSRKTSLHRSGSAAYMPARPFMTGTPWLLKRIHTAISAKVEDLVRNAQSK